MCVYIDIFIRGQEQMIDGTVYKLFYLADDHTNSVFEKVFVADDDVLKNIRFSFNN